MNDKFLNLLGLCRRAGKLQMGFEAVKSAIYRGESRLAITAADLSEKTLKEITFLCQQNGSALIKTRYGMMDITGAVGMKTGIISITDAGFAKKAEQLLEKESFIYDDKIPRP